MGYSEVGDTLQKKSPVVVTCGIFVLQDLRRTKAVLAARSKLSTGRDCSSGATERAARIFIPPERL
jgi:hypothetical protein